MGKTNETILEELNVLYNYLLATQSRFDNEFLAPKLQHLETLLSDFLQEKSCDDTKEQDTFFYLVNPSLTEITKIEKLSKEQPLYAINQFLEKEITLLNDFLLYYGIGFVKDLYFTKEGNFHVFMSCCDLPYDFISHNLIVQKNYKTARENKLKELGFQRNSGGKFLATTNNFNLFHKLLNELYATNISFQTRKDIVSDVSFDLCCYYFGNPKHQIDELKEKVKNDFLARTKPGENWDDYFYLVKCVQDLTREISSLEDAPAGNSSALDTVRSIFSNMCKTANVETTISSAYFDDIKELVDYNAKVDKKKASVMKNLNPKLLEEDWKLFCEKFQEFIDGTLCFAAYDFKASNKKITATIKPNAFFYDLNTNAYFHAYIDEIPVDAVEKIKYKVPTNILTDKLKEQFEYVLDNRKETDNCVSFVANESNFAKILDVIHQQYPNAALEKMETKLHAASGKLIIDKMTIKFDDIDDLYA